MNNGLKFGLGFTGMTTAEIADLEAKLPAMGRLGTAGNALEPIMEAAAPHIEALQPLLAEAMPHILALLPLAAQAMAIAKPAWPDVKAVTPTARMLIAFAEGAKK